MSHRNLAKVQLLRAILDEIAALRADIRAAAERPRGGETGHSYHELRAMVEAGLEPAKELGPHDPRASNPHCAHGRSFAEPCERCEGRQGLDIPGPVGDNPPAS